MTQPPPYGSPQSYPTSGAPQHPYPTSGAPQQPYPTSGAPQQPDQWGQRQPASWGQQPQQPGVYGQAQSGVYGQAQQQPGVYGQPQPGVYGQPQQDQWGQQPPQQDQWGQQPADQWGQQPQADQWGQQPPPGQWGQQQPPPPPRQGGTNGFAIASLIFGLLGGILLSVIFGFVALSQIKKRGQGGRGLAIAGLSLSGVWVLGIVALVIAALVAGGGSTNDPTTSLADSGDVNVQRLTAGQCLNGLKEGSAIRDLPAVPCTQPHEGEVFATFDLADGDFPGDAEVGKLAEDGCVDRLKTYSAKAAEDPNVEIYFLHPTQTSWRLGDQGVACVAMSSTGKVTGSIKD